MKSLSDSDLSSMTEKLKARLKDNESIEIVLPEAFALVREASQRTLGLRHYDVQLIGGMVLNEGSISEMGTGEGKTLVATLPAYLNAITGKRVHIVTVNDYLASRDAEWMERFFLFWALLLEFQFRACLEKKNKKHIRVILPMQQTMSLVLTIFEIIWLFSQEQKMQKELSFAIIDEVDSILIDEARTPLVISGPTGDHAQVYKAINKMIPALHFKLKSRRQEVEVLVAGDYTIDEKHKQVFLSDDGHTKAEDMLIEVGALQEGASLYDASNIILLQHLISGLRAHVLFQKT